METSYTAAPGTPIKIENFEGAKAAGMDPAMLSMLQGTKGSDMMSNPLLWLITLGFLGKNGGLLGGGNAGDAAALASTTTAKDVAAQLNALGLSEASNFHQIQEALCANGRSADQNTASIIAGQSAQNMNAAQSQAAITSAITNGNFALASQLAKCCCDNQLAAEQTKNLVNVTALQTQNQLLAGFAANANQLSAARCDILNATAMQTCELEKSISRDGSLTRTLINDLRISELQQQLDDAKNIVTSLTNTGATSQIVGGAVDRITALIRSCPCDTKSNS